LRADLLAADRAAVVEQKNAVVFHGPADPARASQHAGPRITRPALEEDHPRKLLGVALRGDDLAREHLERFAAGRGGGTLKPGRHVRYSKETPLNNLWLSLLERMDAKLPSLGDSTYAAGRASATALRAIERQLLKIAAEEQAVRPAAEGEGGNAPPPPRRPVDQRISKGP
jgi:hypothetical protein